MISIMETPELDDHWKEESPEKPLNIGYMVILRDDETLFVDCRIPSRSFRYITMAMASKKIKFASVYGTRLKWRQGKVFYISLSTNRPRNETLNLDLN